MTDADEDVALARLVAAGADLGVPEQRYGPDPDQVLERHGSADAPALVVVHGGFFRPGTDRTHARPQARALADSGWQVVLVEYRRVPGAPFATIEDLAALDARLRDLDVRAWVGHSAGGALVLWRALTPDLPPTRAVALAPVADFAAAVRRRLGEDAVRDWIGAGPEEAPETYAGLDPTRLLAADPGGGSRVQLVHGTEDATVPVTQTQALTAPSTLIDGAHHYDLIDPASAYWPRVLEVIRRAAPRSG